MESYIPTYNVSKLALLVEDRPSPVLAPLVLHFISILPPDWRFLFLGSSSSLATINMSAAVQAQVATGKLELRWLPTKTNTSGTEMISRFLTSLWLYETAIGTAEWLLVFQSDSMVCANSRLTVDDFLDYDWVGAPWNPEGDWGGNGGLSLRRVSHILDILRNQQRADNSEPEDVWLAERLAHYPDSRVANGSLSLTFSGERHSGLGERVASANFSSPPFHDAAHVAGLDDWREGFYEPMGYHTGGSGIWLHGPIWGTPERRDHVWRYCPEVKMTLAMDMARYIPGNCGTHWARSLTLDEDGEARSRKGRKSGPDPLTGHKDVGDQGVGIAHPAGYADAPRHGDGPRP